MSTNNLLKSRHISLNVYDRKSKHFQRIRLTCMRKPMRSYISDVCSTASHKRSIIAITLEQCQRTSGPAAKQHGQTMQQYVYIVFFVRFRFSARVRSPQSLVFFHMFTFVGIHILTGFVWRGVWSLGCVWHLRICSEAWAGACTLSFRRGFAFVYSSASTAPCLYTLIQVWTHSTSFTSSSFS